MSANIDPLKTGMRDNGSGDGVIDVYLRRGGLCRFQPRTGTFGASVGASASSAIFTDQCEKNPDGSNAKILMSSGSNQIGGFSAVNFAFRGRVFGIYYQSDTNTPDFTVAINGVCHRVFGYDKYVLQGNGNGDQSTYLVIADDLPHDGPHRANIYLHGLASGSQTVNIWGFLLEERAGYREGGPYCITVRKPVTLTSSFAAFATNPAGVLTGDQSIRAITQIRYCNVDTSAHTVTLQYNGVTVCSPVLAAATSAGSEYIFTPPQAISVVGGGGLWTHKAEANSVVNVTYFGQA